MAAFDADDILRNLAARLIDHRDHALRSSVQGGETALVCDDCDGELLLELVAKGAGS
jgi:hypothetical protein